MNLRERKKRNTREAILKVSRELFLTSGYRGTSMERIAGEACVSVGTIYNYFSSKAAVMVELNSMETGRVIDALDGMDRSTGSVEDMIWQVLSGVLTVMKDYSRELVRELVVATVENSTGELSSGLMKQDERFLAFLVSLLSDLRDNGRIAPEVDPEASAYGIYSLALGGILLHAVDENVSNEDMRGLIAAMIGQFCRGLVPGGGVK